MPGASKSTAWMGLDVTVRLRVELDEFPCLPKSPHIKQVLCRHGASLLLSTAVGAAACQLEPPPRCLRTLFAPGAEPEHFRYAPTSTPITRIILPVDAVCARFARNRRLVIHRGRGAAVVLTALVPLPAPKRCALHLPRHWNRVCPLAALPSLTFAAMWC